MAQTTRSRSAARKTTRTTHPAREGRLVRIKNALVEAGREPRKTSRRVVDNATRQLERIGEGLEQAAVLTRRAGDALEDMSQNLLRAAEQMRSNGRKTTTAASRISGTRTGTVRRRGLVASRRRSGITRTTRERETGSEDLRVAGVGA